MPDKYTPTHCTTNLALFLEPPPVEQRRITLAGRNRHSAMSLRPSNDYDKGGKRSGWRDRRMRRGQGGHRWRKVVLRNLFIPPRTSESVNTTTKKKKYPSSSAKLQCSGPLWKEKWLRFKLIVISLISWVCVLWRMTFITYNADCMTVIPIDKLPAARRFVTLR